MIGPRDKLEAPRDKLEAALLVAIEQCDAAGVQRSLDDGANLEAVMVYDEKVVGVTHSERMYEEGHTHDKSLHVTFDALHLAAEVGDAAIVTLLLAAGKSPSTALRCHPSL